MFWSACCTSYRRPTQRCALRRPNSDDENQHRERAKDLKADILEVPHVW
jgi:hypothetical protein